MLAEKLKINKKARREASSPGFPQKGKEECLFQCKMRTRRETHNRTVLSVFRMRRAYVTCFKRVTIDLVESTNITCKGTLVVPSAVSWTTSAQVMVPPLLHDGPACELMQFVCLSFLDLPDSMHANLRSCYCVIWAHGVLGNICYFMHANLCN